MQKAVKNIEPSSRLKVGDVQLPVNAEMGHILITGGTGSGKSVAIKSITNQLRGSGWKIISTCTAEDMEARICEGDIVLNPFDDRFPVWNLWNECKTIMDYTFISEVLIPLPIHDSPICAIKTARLVLASMFSRTNNINELIDLSNGSLSEMLVAPIGTVAASGILNRESAIPTENDALLLIRKAVNVLSNSSMTSQTKEIFSVCRWASNPNDKRSVFLPIVDEKMESIAPLYSILLSLVCRELLSQEPNRTHRVLLSLDEFGRLPMVESLPSALTVGRRFGLHSIICVSSASKLEEVYGAGLAESIIYNCATHLAFQALGGKDASYLSSVIHRKRNTNSGEYEIPPSQLQTLPNLSCYVVSNGKPIVKTTISFDR